jgi:hypothetical protein
VGWSVIIGFGEIELRWAEALALGGNAGPVRFGTSWLSIWAARGFAMLLRWRLRDSAFALREWNADNVVDDAERRLGFKNSAMVVPRGNGVAITAGWGITMTGSVVEGDGVYGGGGLFERMVASSVLRSIGIDMVSVWIASVKFWIKD